MKINSEKSEVHKIINEKKISLHSICIDAHETVDSEKSELSQTRADSAMLVQNESTRESFVIMYTIWEIRLYMRQQEHLRSNHLAHFFSNDFRYFSVSLQSLNLLAYPSLSSS